MHHLAFKLSDEVAGDVLVLHCALAIRFLLLVNHCFIYKTLDHYSDILRQKVMIPALEFTGNHETHHCFACEFNHCAVVFLVDLTTALAQFTTYLSQLEVVEKSDGLLDSLIFHIKTLGSGNYQLYQPLPSFLHLHESL